MKKYNRCYLSVRLPFFPLRSDRAVLLKPCPCIFAHLGSLPKSRANAILQTTKTSSQTLISEEKNQEDENIGQSF